MEEDFRYDAMREDADRDDADRNEAELQQEFSGEDRKKLRKMIIRRDHREWLWGITGAYAKWIGSIGAAVVALKLLWNELRGLLP